jgi:transposase
MLILGIDAHKRTHTIVAVDEQGRPRGERTVGTSSKDHLELVEWARSLGGERRWAVEDCRHLSRRLERDLLMAGEKIVRVPPKLMAHARDSARTYGKSDPIDALAVARAALREPGLPAARLDGDDRVLQLLVDHRDDLVAERTRLINRLRWHLHELDPACQPPARSLCRAKHVAATLARIADAPGTVARLARQLLARCDLLNREINELAKEIETLARQQAPSLVAVPGCGALTAAKIVGETAGIERFRDKNAYARHNGTAPLPVWSGNRERHRLSRTGNRQLNLAMHRIALTQARHHPGARQYLDRRRAAGNTTAEALRALKRRLSDVVFRALLADVSAVVTSAEEVAA